jgi:kynurenine formamidase
LKVVDLTQPLGPSTPVIDLPPIFAASPGVTIDVIVKGSGSPLRAIAITPA